MSIGPRGGAPVPSITVTPRMTRRSNGPSPSPARRVGVGCICCAESETVAAMTIRAAPRRGAVNVLNIEVLRTGDNLLIVHPDRRP